LNERVIIIGAGHNGLIAAFYLAKAGLKPLVLERRDTVGGAAITEEIHPGFHCPTLSHVAGPLSGDIARDLNLARHGVEWIRPDPSLFAPREDGLPLILHRDPVQSSKLIGAFSSADAQRYPKYQKSVENISSVLRGLLAQTPPSIESPTIGDAWGLLKGAYGFRRLGKADAYRLLRWIPMPAADLVGEWFDSEPLKAALAARGVFGASLGPRSPGSGALMLVQSALGTGAETIAFVRGGPGALTAALAAAAREAGAEIRTGVTVSRITSRGDETAGVVVDDGSEIEARVVVSNIDPRRTLLDLVGPTHLDPTFVGSVMTYRSAGTVAKVNLALSGLPRFEGADPDGRLLAGRIHIGPTLDHIERAFDEAKYGDFSTRPWLDVAIPSLSDPSIAPAGAHVMSVNVQYAPYHLKAGSWVDRRESLGDTVVQEIARYAPQLPGLVVHRQVLTPLDLEERYGLTGGHIFHGEPGLDQLFSMRPFYGWARYRTPIRGLYLCGAGTHPGCGVNGLSGANASREILKDLR
jgi:phytoene dehydrogenase-like protein